MIRKTRVLALVLAVLALGAITQAEQGFCRYDNDRCSCRMGDAGKGVCWDLVTGSPGTCRRRSCAVDWTCTCGGRTHVCYRGSRKAYTVAAEDKRSATAPCTQKTILASSGTEIRLGTFEPQISPKGTAAGNCLEMAWWHNSELMGNYQAVQGMDQSQVVNELEVRQGPHEKLELKGGDVISWRFLAASYYCQLSSVQLTVNGTAVNLNTPGVTILYAKAFTAGWFEPTFSPVLGNDETVSNLQAFIPLRKTKLDGRPIIAGADVWEPQARTPDNVSGDFYFRMTLPHSLTTVHHNKETSTGTDFGSDLR